MDWATDDYTRTYGDTIFVPPSSAYEGIYLLDEANRGEDPITDSPPAVPILPYGGWQSSKLEAMPWSWPDARNRQTGCRDREGFSARAEGRGSRRGRGRGRTARTREAGPRGQWGPGRGGSRASGREGFIGEDPRGGGAPGLTPIFDVAWDERPGESPFSCRECSGEYQGCLHCGDPRAGITDWSSWRHPYGAWPRCAEYQELMPPWSKRPYNGGPAPSQTYAIGGPWKVIPPKAFRLPSVATVDAHCNYPDGWQPATPGELPSPPLEIANPPEPFVSGEPRCGCPFCSGSSTPHFKFFLLILVVVLAALVLAGVSRISRKLERVENMTEGMALGYAMGSAQTKA